MTTPTSLPNLELSVGATRSGHLFRRAVSLLPTRTRSRDSTPTSRGETTAIPGPPQAEVAVPTTNALIVVSSAAELSIPPSVFAAKLDTPTASHLAVSFAAPVRSEPIVVCTPPALRTLFGEALSIADSEITPERVSLSRAHFDSLEVSPGSYPPTPGLSLPDPASPIDQWQTAVASSPENRIRMRMMSDAIQGVDMTYAHSPAGPSRPSTALTPESMNEDDRSNEYWGRHMQYPSSHASPADPHHTHVLSHANAAYTGDFTFNSPSQVVLQPNPLFGSTSAGLGDSNPLPAPQVIFLPSSTPSTLPLIAPAVSTSVNQVTSQDLQYPQQVSMLVQGSNGLIETTVSHTMQYSSPTVSMMQSAPTTHAYSVGPMTQPQPMSAPMSMSIAHSVAQGQMIYVAPSNHTMPIGEVVHPHAAHLGQPTYANLHLASAMHSTASQSSTCFP